jgi:hypothetical protein
VKGTLYNSIMSVGKPLAPKMFQTKKIAKEVYFSVTEGRRLVDHYQRTQLVQSRDIAQICISP